MILLVVMESVASSRFTKEYIGDGKVKEPLVVTHKGVPIFKVYPVSFEVVASVGGEADERKSEKVFKAQSDEGEIKVAHRSGQCQVCYQFGNLEYGRIMGERGITAKWVCTTCFGKSKDINKDFGPKGFFATKRIHTFK